MNETELMAREARVIPPFVLKVMHWMRVEPRDIDDAVTAAANRLQDIRAFAKGGAMSDGVVVPGQQQVLDVLERIEKRLDDLEAKKSEVKK